MEPVYPKQLDVPLLISGDWSHDVSDLLSTLSLKFRIIEGAVGRASSIKMVRSIMVKGLEALTAECALAAYAADVVDEVFPSLRDGHPKIDVQQRATYNFERSMTHGVRRAAEMEIAPPRNRGAICRVWWMNCYLVFGVINPAKPVD